MNDLPPLPVSEMYRRRRPLSCVRLTLDARRAARDGPPAIVFRQEARLRAIVAHARANSPFYRDRWAGLPDTPSLDQLPPVTKPELMARFDDWVTDPRVALRAVEAFIADPSRAGTLLGGQFAVRTTSGTTGEPGVFVHDRVPLGVYDALTVTRAHALTPGRLPRVLVKGLRIAPRPAVTTSARAWSTSTGAASRPLPGASGSSAS